MQFFSTRNYEKTVDAPTAITEGIAKDGGLYLPASFPSFPMERLPGMSDEDVSFETLALLFDEFSEEELRGAIRSAYAENFENGDISPLAQVGDAYLMELFHGPTCAFKDVALCLLPHLLRLSAKKLGIREDICILTATSGDTGSAALFGFSDVPGTKIVVFYPHGGVSPMQRKQMVACPGKNTAVAAVKGNFDDAQTGVKNIFADQPKVPGVRFSSANSINIGRLAPQIAYYFKSYRDLLKNGKIKMGDRVNFVVPTGNFGDILAGYFAKKMGLPVGRLICASNVNRVLTDFFETGVYDKNRPFHLSASASMDILISSNLERLISLTVGPEKTAEYMESLRKTGRYELDAASLSKLQSEFFGANADDKESALMIRKVFEKYHYVMDPHTAVGYAVYEKFMNSSQKDDAVTVILSTASPYKFSRAVLPALGLPVSEDETVNMQTLHEVTGTPIPKSLFSALTADEVHKDVIAIDGMPSYVAGKAATL